MRHVRRLWIPPLLAGIVVACEVNTFGNGGAPTMTNLRAGPGVAPTFSWTGHDADQLTVRRFADDETVWLVTDYAGMQSPITYGIPPTGAEERVRVEAVLTEGVMYEVEVMAFGFSTAVRARWSFVP